MANKLDSQEQELLELFEQNKLKRSKNVTSLLNIAKTSASQHIKKDARINIRLSRFDLDRIKRIAITEGLPYQTLISSILHKYTKNIFEDNSKDDTRLTN